LPLLDHPDYSRLPLLPDAGDSLLLGASGFHAKAPHWDTSLPGHPADHAVRRRVGVEERWGRAAARLRLGTRRRGNSADLPWEAPSRMMLPHHIIADSSLSRFLPWVISLREA